MLCRASLATMLASGSCSLQAGDGCRLSCSGWRIAWWIWNC